MLLSTAHQQLLVCCVTSNAQRSHSQPERAARSFVVLSPQPFHVSHHFHSNHLRPSHSLPHASSSHTPRLTRAVLFLTHFLTNLIRSPQPRLSIRTRSAYLCAPFFALSVDTAIVSGISVCRLIDCHNVCRSIWARGQDRPVVCRLHHRCCSRRLQCSSHKSVVRSAHFRDAR